MYKANKEKYSENQGKKTLTRLTENLNYEMELLVHLVDELEFGDTFFWAKRPITKIFKHRHFPIIPNEIKQLYSSLQALSFIAYNVKNNKTKESIDLKDAYKNLYTIINQYLKTKQKVNNKEVKNIYYLLAQAYDPAFPNIFPQIKKDFSKTLYYLNKIESFNKNWRPDIKDLLDLLIYSKYTDSIYAMYAKQYITKKSNTLAYMFNFMEHQKVNPNNFNQYEKLISVANPYYFIYGIFDLLSENDKQKLYNAVSKVDKHITSGKIYLYSSLTLALYFIENYDKGKINDIPNINKYFKLAFKMEKKLVGNKRVEQERKKSKKLMAKLSNLNDKKMARKMADILLNAAKQSSEGLYALLRFKQNIISSILTESNCNKYLSNTIMFKYLLKTMQQKGADKKHNKITYNFVTKNKEAIKKALNTNMRLAVKTNDILLDIFNKNIKINPISKNRKYSYSMVDIISYLNEPYNWETSFIFIIDPIEKDKMIKNIKERINANKYEEANEKP